MRTCSSNRTRENRPSGMIVERGGDVIGLLDGTLTARLLATRPPPSLDLLTGGVGSLGFDHHSTYLGNYSPPNLMALELRGSLMGPPSVR